MQTSSARFRTIFIGILVAVSLFAGVMAGTAGAALFPSMFRVAGPLICAGEIDIVSQSYSYKPGQRGVSRTVYCVTNGGAERKDVTFRAVFASVLAYSVLALPIVALLMAPLARRLSTAFSALTEATRLHRGLPRASIVMQAPAEASRSADDTARRLAELKRLRDAGLITEADYEAKKAEILAAL